MGLARLSSGHLAYWASDLQFVGSRFVWKIFLSVVDVGGRRTCPDAEIPVPADPRPWAAFRGETLVVLTPNGSNGTGAEGWVKKYLVDTTDCRWVASEGLANGNGS